MACVCFLSVSWMQTHPPAARPNQTRVLRHIIHQEGSMNKLRLNLDELSVETFESLAVSEQRGTVEARAVPTGRTNCNTECVSSPCFCW
jgi:hypothetical protein